MKRFDQINVIPFIDIMLVLLAIVLTTATFISQGRLDIDVPKASSKSPPTDASQVIRLAIDNHETIYYQENPVTLEKLQERISSLESDSKIILSVDRTVAFQRFVHILDLLKQQRIEQLSIITSKTK